MIKDNHIALAGGIKEAVKRARAFAGHMTVLEIEVDDLAQVEEAIEAKPDALPDALLLDNMSLENMAQAVKLAQGKCVLEASGNMDMERVAAVAQTGIDLISASRLTMSAPALDLGLDIEVRPASPR